jgi:hypothetical protein
MLEVNFLHEFEHQNAELLTIQATVNDDYSAGLELSTKRINTS